MYSIYYIYAKTNDYIRFHFISVYWVWEFHFFHSNESKTIQCLYIATFFIFPFFLHWINKCKKEEKKNKNKKIIIPIDSSFLFCALFAPHFNSHLIILVSFPCGAVFLLQTIFSCLLFVATSTAIERCRCHSCRSNKFIVLTLYSVLWLIDSFKLMFLCLCNPLISIFFLLSFSYLLLLLSPWPHFLFGFF